MTKILLKWHKYAKIAYVADLFENITEIFHKTFFISSIIETLYLTLCELSVQYTMWYERSTRLSLQ